MAILTTLVQVAAAILLPPLAVFMVRGGESGESASACRRARATLPSPRHLPPGAAPM
jgi:hypothetical protein